jgi:4-amino-4-deoxy-L-arabinose transferase-like glycosyltransferase
MTPGRAARDSLLVVLAVALPLLALRLFTPYELQATDQGKQAQYVLDVVRNGNWLAPGCLGVAATKPPLYTWLAALVSKTTGTIDETTIRVPTVLAALGLVLVTWDIARRLAGPRVAAAAGVALATSHHFVHLSGVVRTDGLLAFLLAAQMLVYVRSIGRPSMPLAGIVASALLAGAACLAKGPGGLLSCAAVALHLVLTKRGRRAWLEAGVPALAGVAVLVAWFVAAGQTRADVYDTMVSRELVRHVARAGAPNPLYYVLHMPFRLTPWVALLGPAVWIAARTVRASSVAACPPLVSLAFVWIAVHFAMFSFVSHQRPDLIYPAEPAVLLLVAALADRKFPAWAPRWVAAGLVAAAASLFVPFVRDRFADGAATPALVAMAAICLAGAAAAFAPRWRADAAAACFIGLAAFGVANSVRDTVGLAPSVSRASYLAFAETARAEAARRGVRLCVTGLDNPAVTFDLGLTETMRVREIAKDRRAWLIVTAPPALATVGKVIGPFEILARHLSVDASRESFVLVAPK